MKAKAGDARVRIMIVDDHKVMRDALRNVISLEPDLVLVAEAENGQAAIESIERNDPDVVLMDGSMPGISGVETTRRLRELRPDLKIIGLTLYEETTYLEEMIEFGASGYLLKTGSPLEIVKAVRTVAGGGTYFDQSIPRRLVSSVSRQVSVRKLSDQELAVAKLVANGWVRSEIATALGLRTTEVDALRAAAMSKLGLRNRAELVRVANERNWLNT